MQKFARDFVSLEADALDQFEECWQSIAMSLIAFDGPVWRLLTEDLIATPSAHAKAPEGRFHHAGQIAAYASLTAEGAAVAMKRYLTDNQTRTLLKMWLKAEAVADVRGEATASVVWQDQWAGGATPSTWEISDAARRAGAQALLYSSRSRPDLSHVVVFDPACLTQLRTLTPTAIKAV